MLMDWGGADVFRTGLAMFEKGLVQARMDKNGVPELHPSDIVDLPPDEKVREHVFAGKECELEEGVLEIILVGYVHQLEIVYGN